MSTRFSLNSSNHSGRSAPVIPLFVFCLGFSRGSHQFPEANSSLRSNNEPEDELEADSMLFPAAISTSLLNESCDGDVEDETLPELADNPATTRGTIDSFNMATDPFAPPFFDFLLGFPSASTCRKQIHPFSDLQFSHTGGCQNVHDGFLQNLNRHGISLLLSEEISSLLPDYFEGFGPS